MSYREDPIYHTIHWLRADQAGETSFRSAFSDAWARWARVSPRDVEMRLGLVNYKPFERARVMADMTFVPGRAGSAPVTLNLFIHIFADDESARREFEKSAGNAVCCCYGPSVFQIEDHSAVVWVLPNAPNLKKLRDLLDPERFAEFIASASRIPINERPCGAPSLVRYVPLKRALLTCDRREARGRYYVKLINQTEAAAAALNLMEMSERAEHGELEFNVPRLVHYSPSWHTIMMTEVPGRPFTQIMRKARPETFADVGKALACLHSSAATPATIWSPEKELTDLRRHMRGVKLALPHIATRLDALVVRLEQSLPVHLSSYKPIHGNLFGDQILYHENAAERRVGVVDWDAWSIGDPHYDLGRLIAHWLYIVRVAGLTRSAFSACTAALLEAYENATQRAVERPTLQWHVAASLLQRTKISSLRKLCPDWQGHFDIMIPEAEAILGEACFHARRKAQAAFSSPAVQHGSASA